MAEKTTTTKKKTTASKAAKKTAKKPVAKKSASTKKPARKAPAAKAGSKTSKTAKTAKTAKPVKKGGIRSLVIVESPAKARTIEKYLGPDFPNFKVMASVGHVIDLPTSSLGVDVDSDFEPQYEVIKGKKGIVDALKRQARAADRIYLAPDPDREGEAIAYHIAQLIKNGKGEVHRAVFHEVTREAIRHAIENPAPGA